MRPNLPVLFAKLTFCFIILFARRAGADGFTLTVSSKGSGTITEEPSASTYATGAVVVVTANPSLGWKFSNWSGDVSSTTNPLSVTVNSNLSIVAHFSAIPQYTVTVQTVGQGTIGLNPSGGTYYSNTVVTLTATPVAGWKLQSWSGDVISDTNPLSLTVNSNMAITANFTSPPQFTLTLQTNGQGTIGLSPAGGTYFSNTVVTASAMPAAGWKFDSWSGDANSGSNSVPLMMNTNRTLTASFSVLPVYTLGVQAIGQGAILLNPTGGSYWSNEVVTVTAAAGAGWVFDSWSGDINSVTSPLALTMRTNRALTGRFGQLPAFDLQPHGVVTGTGSTVTFSAHAVGSTPLVLQWYYSGGVVAGETNTTLTLTNVSAAQAWNYWCKATNRYGSAMSSKVSLVLTNAGDGTYVIDTLDESLLHAVLDVGGKATFNCDGTIILSRPLTVANSSEVDAAGHAIILSGNNAVRVFEVSSNVILTVRNLTVANGRTNNGAGLYNNGGMVTLSNVIFSGNQAVGAKGASSVGLAPTGTPAGAGETATGGAIYNTGALSLYQCQFLANGAAGGNGGDGSGSDMSAYTGGSGGIGQGAALYSTGPLIANGCQFSSNSVSGGQGGSNNPFSGPGGGNAAGGALYANSAELTNCVIAGNGVRGGDGGPADHYLMGVGGPGGQASGGAIYVTANLTMQECALSSNQTTGGDSPGLGANPSSSAGRALGGAVFNAGGTVSLLACSLAGNRASCGYANHRGATVLNLAAGGAIYNVSGDVSVVNSTISSNSASGEAAGGGIYHGAGTLTISGGGILGNQAVSQNAYEAAVLGGPVGAGGGLFNGATASIFNCTIGWNTAMGASGYSSDYNRSGSGGAAQGGGICNAGSLDISRCTMAGNVAVGGPAGSNSQVPASGGIGYGGGIYNSGSVLRIVNCTVAANSATGGAGAISAVQAFAGGNSYGGGIYNNASGSLTYCTLAGNAAVGGAGAVSGTKSSPAGVGYGGNIGQAGGLQLVNTIVASGVSSNAYGTVTDLGSNISSDTSCAFAAAGSLNSTDPMLAGLADNGGPTQTMALSPGSPAINAAVSQPGIDMDQRGRSRPVGSAPDIGAYEANAVVYQPFRMTLQNVASGAFHLSGSGPANVIFRVQVSSNLVSWTEYTTSRSDEAGLFELMDFGPAAGVRFYRIVPP